MTCDRIEAGDLLERYLGGDLDEETGSAVEIHFFECERCFESLRTLEVMRAELKGLAPLPSETAPPALRRWLVPSLAAGLVLLVAIAVWQRDRKPETIAHGPAAPTGPEGASGYQAPDAGKTTQPSPRSVPDEVIARLASVEPPAWDDVVLRGMRNDAGRLFRSARALYVKGDYSGAAGVLERAAAIDPKAAHIHFFLGVSRLLSGDGLRAVSSFHRVLEDPASPFTEEGRWFLAKSLLATHDVTAARRELERIAASGGVYAGDAKTLLEELRRAGEE